MQISVSGRTLQIPRECVCCGGPAEVSFGASATQTRGKTVRARVNNTRTNEWTFHLCEFCAAHDRRESEYANSTTGPVVGGVIALIGAAALSQGAVAPGIALLVIGGVIAAAGISHRRTLREKALTPLRPECTDRRAQSLVRYAGWNGSIHTFHITAPRYAEKFIIAKQSKLINISPKVAEILDRHQANRTTVTPSFTPAPSFAPNPSTSPIYPTFTEYTPPIQTDDDLLRYWINKIETQKNISERKILLKAGLSMLQAEENKQNLVLEASRIEVDVVLNRIKTLKTESGKRKALQSVIDEIKADQVPDEIQDVLLQKLEEAMSEIGTMPAAPAPPAASVADRLRQLDGLKADGLVSDAEYQERRARILEDV